MIWLYAIAGGILYSLGGRGGAWWKNTKTRDVGVPLLMLAYFAHMGQFHWSLLICAVLLFASLTTYWKKKGEDAKWWNWALVGLGYSLSMLPYAWATGCWLGFGIRTVVLTILTCVVSEFFDNVNLEEGSRGFLIILSLWFLI